MCTDVCNKGRKKPGRTGRVGVCMQEVDVACVQMCSKGRKKPGRTGRVRICMQEVDMSCVQMCIAKAERSQGGQSGQVGLKIMYSENEGVQCTVYNH